MGPILWGVDPVVYTPPPKNTTLRSLRKARIQKKRQKTSQNTGEPLGGKPRNPETIHPQQKRPPNFSGMYQEISVRNVEKKPVLIILQIINRIYMGVFQNFH